MPRRTCALLLLVLAVQAYFAALPLRAANPGALGIDPAVIYAPTVVTTPQDITLALNAVAADTAVNPRNYTGNVLLAYNNGRLTIGLGYRNNGGPRKALGFTMSLLGSVDAMLTNDSLPLLQAQINDTLANSLNPISSELFILNGQLYLIVVNRQ